MSLIKEISITSRKGHDGDDVDDNIFDDGDNDHDGSDVDADDDEEDEDGGNDDEKPTS